VSPKVNNPINHSYYITQTLLSGNHDGLGDIRVRELEKSCAVLGIDIRHVVVLDHP
jgi:LmbE family N-acetylglucosaminyl deacetylase